MKAHLVLLISAHLAASFADAKPVDSLGTELNQLGDQIADVGTAVVNDASAWGEGAVNDVGNWGQGAVNTVSDAGQEVGDFFNDVFGK